MQQNGSQLVIRDVPIFQWVLGILFAGVGILVINQGGPPVFGTIFAAIGAGFLLFSSVLTISADRMTQTLQLDCRSALRHTLKQVPFAEIDGINVERRVSGGKGGFTYRLTLLRKDGQVIPFRSSSSSGWKGKERRAGQLREFLGIQDSNRIPAGMLPAELAQAAEIHETNGVHWRIDRINVCMPCHFDQRKKSLFESTGFPAAARNDISSHHSSFHPPPRTLNRLTWLTRCARRNET